MNGEQITSVSLRANGDDNNLWRNVEKIRMV